MGQEYLPAGEEAPGQGPQQVPGREDGLAHRPQALVVAHQAPREQKQVRQLGSGDRDWQSQGGRGRSRLGVPSPEHLLSLGPVGLATHVGAPGPLEPGDRRRGVLAVVSLPSVLTATRMAHMGQGSACDSAVATLSGRCAHW